MHRSFIVLFVLAVSIGAADSCRSGQSRRGETARKAERQATPATASPGQSPSPANSQTDPFAAIPRITVEELRQALKEKRAFVVDVRPVEAYEEEHIEGAVSLPESEVVERRVDFPPDKLIVTYCA